MSNSEYEFKRIESIKNYEALMQSMKLNISIRTQGTNNVQILHGTKQILQGTEIAHKISLCYPENRTLFRYRRCTDYTISAFENDELWLSSASACNDQFDSLCFIELSELVKHIFKILGIEAPLKYADKLAICKKYSKEFKNWGRRQKIACFTEDVDSVTMWGYYADGGKGFALEYDMDKMTEKLNGFFPVLFPVIYSKNRYNATKDALDWFRAAIINDKALIDALFLVNVSILKGEDWKHEKEWRLIDIPCNLDKNKEFDSINFATPKALYIGASTQKEDENKLCQIAMSKNIEVYKIQPDNDSIENKLKAIKIW